MNEKNRRTEEREELFLFNSLKENKRQDIIKLLKEKMKNIPINYEEVI